MGAGTREPNSTAKILIAEDSPTQAQRLQHILQKQGYQTAVAANGRLALEMASNFRPALIISDVLMPEMDGYELSRRIKDDSNLRDTPVILVTTLSDPQDVIRGLECRADNFILKPYDERYLLSRVQYVLINRELRRTHEADMGVEIYFNGQRHFITADRLQILNLLLSTYDAAIQRNKELNRIKEELQLLNARLEGANDELARRAAQLAAVNEELESFSYSVSHDLRAPLRHIGGYVEMLTEEAEEGLSPEARRHLRIIADASRQMGQLIDDLLEFSRMGRAEMHEESVDPDDLVREAMRGLEMAVQGRDISWIASPLPKVLGDGPMLRQVFTNLLSNAVKYTRARSPARIEIGQAGEKDGRLVFYVRDNGAGFDMKYADKLFGVFQRLHRQDEFEGTGVGLANVKRIIARHGGRIWAEAAPDKGATFFFTLKRAS